MYKQVLCAVAWRLERGAWVSTATTDLLQAPLPQGPVKRRRLRTALTHHAAQAVAEAHIGRSGRAVFDALQRFRSVVAKTRVSRANEWCRLRVAAYWAYGRALLRTAPKPWFSLAWDGTRAGGKEALFAALYTHALGVGMWLPPQVQGAVAVPHTGRRKLPQTAAHRPPRTAATTPRGECCK